MDNISENIANQIRQKIRQKSSVPIVSIQKTSKSNFNFRNYLLLMLLGTTFISVYLLCNDSRFKVILDKVKTISFVRSLITNPDKIKKEIIKPEIEKIEQSVLDKINEKLDFLNNKTKETSHKVWLLGVATNENANLNKKVLSNSNYMKFNKDWTVNKVPETLCLEDDVKKKIEDCVK